MKLFRGTTIDRKHMNALFQNSGAYIMNMLQDGELSIDFMLRAALSSDILDTCILNNTDAWESLVEAALIVGNALQKRVGAISCIRNEKKPRDPGLEISLLDPERSTYLMHLPDNDRYVDISFAGDPLDIAAAMSFFSVVHVSTVNASFGQKISWTNTLSGGLAESVTVSMQTLNDLASGSGGHFIYELRDDYTPTNSTAEALERFQSRLTSSTRVSIFLEDKGTGRFRLRAYGADEPEGSASIYYQLEEFRDVYDPAKKEVLWADNRETIDKWARLKELIGVDYETNSY
jgi:hypothetical protein